MNIQFIGIRIGIINIVNENMFGALRLVSVEQGYDPRDFALVGFGGAGPLHANALGKLMGSWPVLTQKEGQGGGQGEYIIHSRNSGPFLLAPAEGCGTFSPYLWPLVTFTF